MTSSDRFNIIKDNVSIKDVINEYIILVNDGEYKKGTCPFHLDSSIESLFGEMTLYVNPKKKIFYCFACKIGGDVIDFIAKAEKCSPAEAVKILADRYNIDLPDEQSC